MRTGIYQCITCGNIYDAQKNMWVCPKCKQETKACEEIFDTVEYDDEE